MAQGFTYGPGQNLTRNNRFAQMLMQQEQNAPPITAHSQGLASMLRQGLAAYMQGQDSRQLQAAQEAFATPLDQQPPGMAPGEQGPPQAPVDPYGSRRNLMMGLSQGGNERATQMLPWIAQASEDYGLGQEQRAQGREDYEWQKGVDQRYNGSSATWGKTPIWGTDNDGNRVLGVVSDAGTFKPLDTGGFVPERAGLTSKDLGDRIVWVDSEGKFVKEEMKQLGPSQTPEHTQNVASAGASGTQAVKASGEAFETLGKINTNIANIDDAIAAVDRGAETGPIYAMLPSIRTASVELDNIQNRMGLDIIGAVTFGALSKGELDLALNTALPTQLPPAELRAWLVSKKAAQQKLSKYLSDAAIYLGKPGNTVAMWAEMRQPTTDAGAVSNDGLPPAPEGFE